MLIVLTALVLAGADSIDAATLGIFPVSSSDRRVESGLLGQVLLPQAAGAAGSLQPDGAEVRKRTTGEEPSPNKRDAALLLDKIMFALKRAMSEKENNHATSSTAKESVIKHGGGDLEQSSGVITPNDMVSFTGTGLERRGNTHGKVYWRCYFNAVSCF